MTQCKTCKTCEWWEKKYHDQYIGCCRCTKSTEVGSVKFEKDSCDKYQSNDRQEDLELR